MCVCVQVDGSCSGFVAEVGDGSGVKHGEGSGRCVRNYLEAMAWVDFFGRLQSKEYPYEKLFQIP